jgi:NADH-quinone oxidoreductase subunit J
MFTNLLNFNLICIALILSSFLVVFSNHVIFSLFFLVLSFIIASILLLTLECEFLALIFIIVYVGAIAVLFLFLIMMIDIKFKNLSKNVILYFSTGSVFVLLFFGLIVEKILILNKNISSLNKTINYNYYMNWGEIIWCVNEIQIYSFVLYSYYVVQFLITGLILLVVLVAIVYFTKTKYSKQNQSILKQVSKSSKFYIN